MIRIAYLCAYSALSALGAALAGRPALVWARSQGLFAPVLAWDVRYGGLLLSAATLLALLTARLAAQAASRRSVRASLHAAFLLVVGACLALRSASGHPRPPLDPAPALLEALRVAASELESGWTGRYAPEAARFDPPLARVAPPAFCRLGRAVAFHARVLSQASGPQLDRIEDDPPGTIYVAISEDRQSAWLTAVALGRIASLPSGAPAVIEARRGTHGLPGQDPALPAYPRTETAPAGRLVRP
jgi:hypothetical protein